MIIDPKEVSVGKFHNYILSSIAPRPIGFVSTISQTGLVNLSPYSFFNAFGANPPIMIFSPARRVRDNTQKHSFENVKEVPEVVINVVNHAIIEQMSLSSTEYEKGVNEFTKSGLTQVPSERVRPPRVAECPVSYECKVWDIIETGQEGGAGNLVICEVLLAHISDDILDKEQKIDQHLIDLVGRMGGNWYTRTRSGLIEVTKPLRTKGMGVDQIPEPIRTSDHLTGNHLGKLGNVEKLPDQEAIEAIESEPEVSAILGALDGNPDECNAELHKLAGDYLDQGHVDIAWCILMLTV